MFQDYSKTIWDSNIFSDWCVDKVYDYAQSENLPLVKARLMAATIPVFLALQLSFELVLSIPRTVIVIAASTQFIIRFAKDQERSLEKQALLAITTKFGDALVKTVKITSILLFGVLGLTAASLFLPVFTMRQLASWGIVSLNEQFLATHNQVAERPPLLQRAVVATEFFVVGDAPVISPRNRQSLPHFVPRTEATPVRNIPIQNAVDRIRRSPSWDTIRRMMMNGEDRAREEMKRLIDADSQLFYQKITEHNPNLNKSYWNLFLSNPYYRAFVEVLVEATPHQFLNLLLKSNAYAELPLDEQSIISSNGKGHSNHDYASIEVYESDSMLELLLNQYPLRDQSEQLLELFSDAMPELWLKQALMQGTLPIFYRFNHSKLHYLFCAYPFLHQQYMRWYDSSDISFEAFLVDNLESLIESGEAIEGALLTKSKSLLYRVADQMGEERFKTNILCLCQRYPLLKEDLQEIARKIFQEECSTFSNLDIRLDLLLEQNIKGLIDSYMGRQAALFSKDLYLAQQIAQQGKEAFVGVVSHFCHKYPSLGEDVWMMHSKLYQQELSLNPSANALLLTAILKALTSTDESIRFNLNKYPLMMRVLVEELLQHFPTAFYDYLLAPQNDRCEWIALFWKSEDSSFLRVLLQKTPSLFLEVLLAPNAMNRLKGLRSLLSETDLQNPFDETDSLLDFVVRQFYSKERSVFLFDLFEEYLPDLWMRQALLQPVSILNKVDEHKLLDPILKKYPYTQAKHTEWQNRRDSLSFVDFFHLHLEEWIVSGEAYEIALLLKSDEALEQISLLVGEDSFRLAIAELSNKYPALSEKLREKELGAVLKLLMT